MNTIAKALDDKLTMLGYNESIRSLAKSKLDLSLVESKLGDIEDYSSCVEIYKFEEPCTEISRAFLNINTEFIQSEVLEGEIKTVVEENIFHSRYIAADYLLDKRITILCVTQEFKIRIYCYFPTQRIQSLYAGRFYEEQYKAERNDVTMEYKEAFERRGRLGGTRIEDMLSMLVSDLVIDEIIINNLNPRMKMCDEPEKFAESITKFSLRYINSKTNRVGIYESDPQIRRLGNGVTAGVCSNDPYIKLEDMPVQTNFSLKGVSYYWLNKNEKGQEEIGIYTATKQVEQNTYVEYLKASPRIDQIIDEIYRNLKRVCQIETDYSAFVAEAIRSLNINLVDPPMEVIKASLNYDNDSVIPFAYRYRFITNPQEFEQKLYTSIEDNMGREYKYKIAENVLEDLTRIGTKLDYTDTNGELVKRQSIADFNVNAPTAIISKETFIDEEGIPALLGYLYDDIENDEIDNLPIPSTYVDFYIPKTGMANVSMYNGTSLDFSLENLQTGNFFAESNVVTNGEETLPGSTYVTVKYVNSKGDSLKENKIGNVFPNTKYIPEILPVINDQNGREWRLEDVKIEPIIISENPANNVIVFKYVERFARITLSFINREGKRIADDKQEIVQVGEIYDFESKKRIIARDNDEWSLKFTRPSKFVVKEDEDKNKVILVYDIERTEIIIKFINKITNEELIENKVVTAQANKKFMVDVPKHIIDQDGLAWRFVEGGDISIVPKMDAPNEVVLYYVEEKVPVTVRYKNESNLTLVDDKVELVQIGKSYSYEFETALTDFECKHWKLHDLSGKASIVVDKDKTKNVIEGIYEPVLASISIKFVNAEGRAIKSDEITKAQIGAIYDKESLDEITDNYGKAWRCISKTDKIIVKAKEIENQFMLQYEPLMGKVTIRYLDSEQNELMEPKYENIQVGTDYKNRPIEKFTAKDGKHWIINPEKVHSITVKKFEEENIYSIYYEPEKANVELTFYDAYNHELREPQIVESQIGAPLVTKSFEKINDKQGQRWMLETSEPKNLVVKENGNFVKLIYGEIKAKVLVKYLNVETGKPIVDNLVTTVKLGGIYVPNIQQIVLDKNKWHWQYVGEENISIVTKENEQENIIVLNYEEKKANVVLKYRNKQEEKIREDAVKQVQIGKEIKLDPLPKITDSNGLMWKYNTSKIDNKIIVEGDNIVFSIYEPLLADIKVQYVNENTENIIEDKVTKMQVGKEFKPEIIDRITDPSNKIWVYHGVSAESIVVKEQSNIIQMQFNKLLKNVVVNLVDEEGALIAKPQKFTEQVGDIFHAKYENAYKDEEDKEWVFAKIDKSQFNVSEQEDKNIVKVSYAKDLSEVTLNYFSILREDIKESTTEKVQIGSIYELKPPQEIIDKKTTLGWKLPDNYHETYKVKRNPEENHLEVHYEQLKVQVLVKFVNLNHEEFYDVASYQEQVGTNFNPKIEDVLIDNQGREWLYGEKERKGLFGEDMGPEVDVSIKVQRDDTQNVVYLTYRPSLEKVTIKYQEPLGSAIRKPLEVMAQVGSVYEAEVPNAIEDAKKVKWVYNPNSTSSLKVTHNEEENIILLAYEEEKALVTYKYHDEYGNRLRSPKRKLVQIGSSYEPEIENVVEDFQGKVWEYKARSINQLEVSEDESKNVIEMVYAPLKVDAVLRFVNRQGKQIEKDMHIKAQLGSEFTPEVQDKITDEESKLFKFVKCDPESRKIVEIPIGALENPNMFELTYEPVYTEAIVIFKTIDGEKIKEDEKTELQVGTIFDPGLAQYITDEKGIQWELATKEVDSIRLKEDVRENIVAMVYEVAKAEVTVRYRNLDGNIIKKADIFNLKVGEEFIPEIKEEIEDDENKKWVYSMVDPVKLTVGSINNIINVTYQEKKANVLIKYESKDGKQVKEPQKVKVQIGSRFEPSNTTKVIYDAEQIWRFVYNEPSMIIVSENANENVIVQVYSMEERQLEVKKEDEGYYNPDVEKFIDKDLVAEEEEKEKEQEAKRLAEEKLRASSVKFEDSKLMPLEKTMALSNEEKKAIIRLNEINTEMMSYLNQTLSDLSTLNDATLEEKLNECMNEEQKIISDNFTKLIEDDKTGKNLLRIFETITSSEMNDKNFYILQQRKTIMVADYFISKKVSDDEQASYICDRGVITKRIECINEKLAIPVNPKDKHRPAIDAEYKREKVLLFYEKAFVEHYSKSRSIIKDDYFKDAENKNQVSPDVVLLVTNMLQRRALKLLQKIDSFSQEKEIELEAVVKIMSTQQREGLNSMVEKIQDGKIRKMAQKKLKEL